MAQRLLNVRVRPQRVVVLINRDATDAELLLAFAFFSKLWGGRFAQILPVDPNSCDPLTEFRLACSRPEFIYGIGVDDEHWAKATLQSCQPRGYGRRANYCHVTSQTVEEAACREFAEQLRVALQGTPIEIVDFEPPQNRIPVVVPYEYEATWPVELNGRKLTVVPPKPRAFEDLGSPRAWIVDLVSDAKTGRAVKDLKYPQVPSY